MFNLVEKRRLYFIFSGVFIAFGIMVMIYSTIQTGTPFNLGIDFVGGSIYELQFSGPGANESNIREVFSSYGQDNVIIQQVGTDEDYRWSIRSTFEDQATTLGILNDLGEIAPLSREAENIEQVSATIGQEVTRAAILAVFLACLVITGFIIIAFRQIPKALRYGVCAVAAMVHDVMVVLTFASLMGLIAGWEVDALFLTAVLTVVGFSIQDSIVIFDRIRENMPKHLGEPYETIVNRSIWETLHRTSATQLNAFFIMIAILLFGGETIKQFIAVLFIGLLSGSYSSIFTAVPLLVAWEKGEIPFLKGDETLTNTPARVEA